MWWLESGLLAWAGLCCLARGNHRYRSVALGGRVVGRAGPTRLLGTLLIAAALVAPVATLGVAQGLTAFACLVSVVGIAFVLLMSVRPRTALAPTFMLPGTHVRRG